MFNLSGSEIVVILLLALVVLGPEKLPDAIRRFGRIYGELKRMSNSFQDEMRATLDEPMREMRETADLLREQASFDPDNATSDDTATSGDDGTSRDNATSSDPAPDETAKSNDKAPDENAERDDGPDTETDADASAGGDAGTDEGDEDDGPETGEGRPT